MAFLDEVGLDRARSLLVVSRSRKMLTLVEELDLSEECIEQDGVGKIF